MFTSTVVELRVRYHGQRNTTVFVRDTIEQARELNATLAKLPTYRSATAAQVTSTNIEL